MRKLIAVGVTALVLFGVSAYGSYLLKSAQTSGGDHGEGSATTAEGTGKVPQNVSTAGQSAAVRLKPAFRPPYNPEAEPAVSIASNLSDRSQSLKAEEQRLTLRKKLLEAIYQDMRSEEKVVENKKKEVADLLKAAEDTLGALEQKTSEAELRRKVAEEQTDNMKKTMLDYKGVETERLKQMASMYDTMEPEAAAKILQNMADGGNLDTAVQILASMRERQAARVLAQLPDSHIAVQLLDRMKTLKRATAPMK